jgi:hypothetical protein
MFRVFRSYNTQLPICQYISIARRKDRLSGLVMQVGRMQAGGIHLWAINNKHVYASYRVPSMLFIAKAVLG